MGNNINKQQFQQPIHGLWDTIYKHQQLTILKNSLTNQEIQQKIIIFQTKQEFIQEFNMYYQRLRTRHKNIVQIKGISQIQQKICSNKISAHIYVQRIPIRLNMLYQLSQQKSLYILIEMLDGFQFLYKSYKVYFQIFNDMIGLNSQKQVKVWINQQFYLNHPSQINLRYIHQPQDLIIKRILLLIQKCHEKHKFTQQFNRQLQMIRTPYRFPIVRNLVQQYQKHKMYNLKNISPFKLSCLNNFFNMSLKSNKKTVKNQEIKNYSEKLKQKLKQNLLQSKLEQTTEKNKYSTNEEKSTLQEYMISQDINNNKKLLGRSIVQHFSKRRYKFNSKSINKYKN